MIDWNLIAIAVGAITAFLTWLYSMLKPSKNNDASHDIEKEQAIIKEQIKHLKEELDSLKSSVKQNDEKIIVAIEKLEVRLEKFVDLVIEVVRDK